MPLLLLMKQKYTEVNNALKILGIKVYYRCRKSIDQIVTSENIDIVLTALVGYSGLKPTISAIKSGKKIALANKETLVVAGELITRYVPSISPYYILLIQSILLFFNV